MADDPTAKTDLFIKGPVDEKAGALKVLRDRGWQLKGFVIACLRALLADPDAFLQWLQPHRPVPERPGRLTEKAVMQRTVSRNAVRWTGSNLDEVRAVRPDADIIDGTLYVSHARTGQPVPVGELQVVFRRDLDQWWDRLSTVDRELFLTHREDRVLPAQVVDRLIRTGQLVAGAHFPASGQGMDFYWPPQLPDFLDERAQDAS